MKPNKFDQRSSFFLSFSRFLLMIVRYWEWETVQNKELSRRQFSKKILRKLPYRIIEFSTQLLNNFSISFRISIHSSENKMFFFTLVWFWLRHCRSSNIMSFSSYLANIERKKKDSFGFCSFSSVLMYISLVVGKLIDKQ